jgi:hypothetical protein
MAEQFLTLGHKDRAEILEIATLKTGRPAHLLEKDIWVVWALSVLFESPLGNDLTFKGGTSLSKAYQVIDRFSEDIDLTYNIRKLLEDFVKNPEALPLTTSQANKWTTIVKNRLPIWITEYIMPLIQQALENHGLEATLEIGGKDRDKLFLNYDPLKRGTGYVSPKIIFEFGARATGEPNEVKYVVCEAEEHVSGIIFPTSMPKVMKIARTFWEKATAAHVFCAQQRLRGERYSRHWYDLAMLIKSNHYNNILNDVETAKAVAQHKSFFFIEKNIDGKKIDYMATVSGKLCLVPEGNSYESLENDYAKMIEDGVLINTGISFKELMKVCIQAQHQINDKSRTLMVTTNRIDEKIIL